MHIIGTSLYGRRPRAALRQRGRRGKANALHACAARNPLFTPNCLEKTKTTYVTAEPASPSRNTRRASGHGSSDSFMHNRCFQLHARSVTVVTAVSPSLHMPFLDINLENETLTHGLCSDLLPRSTCIYTYTCAVISVTWG